MKALPSTALTLALVGCNLVAGYEPVSTDGDGANTPLSDAAVADSQIARTLLLSGPQAIGGGVCSGPYTVDRRDATATEAETNEHATEVLLSGAGRGAFYGDATCSAGIDQLVISAGTSSNSFYLRVPLAEDVRLHAADFSGRFAPATLDVSVAAPALSVKPLYSLGANWNSYVVDDGANFTSASNTACPIDAMVACLHGGELKRVKVAGLEDCAGLEIADSLGAFDWVCRVTTSGDGEIYSRGLRAGKGLKDLVEPTSWRPMLLEIRSGGVVVASSAETTWWTNPVRALPDNATSRRIVLDAMDDDADGPDQSYEAGTIFTLAVDRNSNGYNINIDGVALVALGQATLSYGGSDTFNCGEVNAEGINGYDSRRCLLASGQQRFIWVEGRFNGAHVDGSAQVLLNLYQTQNSTLRNVHLRQSTGLGLVLRQSHHNRVIQTVIEEAGSTGLTLNGAQYNHLDGIEILRAQGQGMVMSACHFNEIIDILIDTPLEEGLYIGSGLGGGNLFVNLRVEESQDTSSAISIYSKDPQGNRYIGLRSHRNRGYGLIAGGDYHHFVNVVATNNHYAGVRVACSWKMVTNNTFAGVIAANNDGPGISISNGTSGDSTHQNTFSRVTAINNAGPGVSINGADRNVLHQVVVANNGAQGLLVGSNSPSDNAIYDLVSVGSAGPAVELYYATNTHLGGRLFVGSMLSPSSVVGGSNSGLVHESCTATGTTGSETPSGAVLKVGAMLDAAFAGMIFSDDGANGSDQDGGRAEASIDDWSHFDSPTRFWSHESSTFPDEANRGPCNSASCRILDIALADKPSPLHGANGVFNETLPCPAAADGNLVITDALATPNTFLANAEELLRDNVGDDDGLCESNEACIFSPHLGAYQGHGAPTQGACTFSDGDGDGSVSGVTLYGYATVAN